MKRKHKTSVRFERLYLNNRWKQVLPPGTWVIIGIQEWWSSPESFCIKLCFFGFDLHIWFKRKFLEK